MTGRRRHPRYLLNAPVEGTLRVREEVTIEEWIDGEVAVISTVPCRLQETLTLELPGNGSERYLATVQECRAVITRDGAVRHRLRMSVEPVTPTEAPNGDRKAL